MMSPDYISVNAHAKINLYLEVLNRRPDGYHNIETIYQSIDLRDEIRLTSVDKGISILSDNPHIPLDSKNLAYKAVEILIKNSNTLKGIKIHINKNIPVGAGLGGGSADAAAVLVGCNRLWNLKYTISQLQEFGSQLGMDIPFCIVQGTAWGVQRGEIIKEKFKTPLLHLVLVYPELSISTPVIYKEIDIHQHDHTHSIKAMLQSLKNQDTQMIVSKLFNRLENAVFNLYPTVKRTKEILLRNGCMNALMTGSGSVVFGICTTFDEANRIAKIIQNQTGYWVRTAKSITGNLN